MQKNNFIALCQIGDIEKIKELLKQGNVFQLQKNEGLAHACSLKNIDVFKLLLDNGADPNHQDGYILALAVNTSNVEVTKLLLNNPEVDIYRGNYVALRWANKKEHEETRNLLLQRFSIQKLKDVIHQIDNNWASSDLGDIEKATKEMLQHRITKNLQGKKDREETISL